VITAVLCLSFYSFFVFPSEVFGRNTEKVPAGNPGETEAAART